ncbi:MAG: protein kinase [Candidatus Riflebacteria bacterium]|nr:protein kinase [Candidatus Riflebacteria bacterium]
MSTDDRSDLEEIPDETFRAAYRVEKAIGRGGFGDVYLATQTRLDRRVVVKLLRQEAVSDEGTLARFHREARALSQLGHPRVVRLYEYGVWRGRPFIVLEFAEGGSLEQFLGSAGRLEIPEAVRLAGQIAEGLDFLHQQGFLHRDIKPANILLTVDRDVKIGDLGLVKKSGATAVTEDGRLVGTLNYLAPEILRGEPFSNASDLYALGLILYRCLTGELPFPEQEAEMALLISRRINQPAPPIERYRQDLPTALATLVNRLVATDPEARPGTAREVSQALKAIEKQPRRPARPAVPRPTAPMGAARPAAPGPQERTVVLVATPVGRRWSIRWPALVALAAAALLVGLALRLAAPRPVEVRSGSPPAPPVDGLLEAARTPLWITVRLRTGAAARLRVRAVALSGGAGRPAGPVLDGRTEEGTHHELKLGPLQPRVDYELRPSLARGGPAQPLPPVQLASPVGQLLALSADIRQLKLADRILKMEMARKTVSDPVDLEPVTQHLERIRYAARAARLTSATASIYAEGALPVAERWSIYRDLMDLRHLDRFCDARDLPFRSGVERLVAPDLSFGGQRPFPAPTGELRHAFPSNTRLLPSDVKRSFFVISPALQDRIPDELPIALYPPAGLTVREARLELTVTDVQGEALVVERPDSGEYVVLVPPASLVRMGTTTTMSHAWPREWIPAGPIQTRMKLRLRLMPMPGFYRNRRLAAIPVTLSNFDKNCTRFDGLRFLLR